jgi:RND family efflux transporter MFP subunit
MNIRVGILIVFTAVLVGCGSKSDKTESELAKDSYKIEKNTVDTMHLRKQPFNRETISNGILKGAARAELRFKTPGVVEYVPVHNGSRVKKGDVIARLDSQTLQLDYERAQQSLSKAQLDLYDALIGFGYGRDTNNVPADILNVAKIRSGYSSALNSYKIAQIALQNATLTAPHSGVVANLTVKPHEYSSEAVCTIIDDSAFNVEFKVLEGELPYIATGRELAVQPFIDVTQNYSGTIKEINPFVDEKGQIAVTASISNKGGKLIEGMNVKVFIKSVKENLPTVPKSAVVMRDGYDVLFVFNPQTGKAEWRYVDILHSNSTHHVVRGHKEKDVQLDEGEAIIISGNLNLADGSDVEIRK